MARVDIDSIEGIDDIDRIILKELVSDARVSITDIAKKVSITRPAIKSRIKALENKGIITGYEAIINPEGDADGVKFMLFVAAEPKSYLEAANILSKYKVHKEIYSKTGYYNLLAIGFVKNQDELKAYEKSVYSQIKECDSIVEASLHVILNTFKDVDGGIYYDREKFEESEE